ncbi:MAG TPA: hypothetical protein VM597_29840 [Gemmataceae bacterium]|jgi:hypothetical protein|nr:hypothetical protein [Gemmataceae bacterium]
MVRKFAAALVALVIAVGSVFAEEIKGTFVKFADGKLTLKTDAGEKEVKVPADLKQKRKGKDGEEKEYVVADMLGKLKEGTKLTVDHKDGTATNVKVEFQRKKKDN